MRWFFSQPCKTKKYTTSRPRLEALEDRVTPVIGAYAPNPVPPGFVTVDGVALDGVVSLTLVKPGGNSICTGSLLRSQRHILTAAHCVTDDNKQLDVTQVTVTFTFSGWDAPVEYTVMPNDIKVHPRWTGNIKDGNDIAVLTLPSLAPSGPAGLGAAGYLLNTSFQEVGKQFEFAGFGRTGGGDTGGIPGTENTGKRLGYNRFDTRTKPVPFIGSDTGLAFDFDDGSVFNNTLFAWGSPKTPVKDGDSMIGEGDSGGPSFLNGLLAGVSSGVYAVNDFAPDGTFGDIGVVERVSLHRNWIESITDAGYDLKIRMNEQRPEDGVKDTLKLLREGTNVVFYVNDQFYYLDASSRLSSVTIVGSDDSEDFLIDSDLRKIVNFQGGGGNNRVFVRNSSGKATYEVSEGKVSTILGLRALTLNYGGVRAVEVAGDSSDTVQVISVRSGTPLTVVSAGTVEIGGVSGGNLSAIKDTVTVNGTNTLLNINDATWANRRDYDVYNDQLTVDPFRLATTIKYQGLSILNLQGGSAGNVFTVFGTPALIARLYSGAGTDRTNVYATSPGTFAIDGQGGDDTVTVGLGRSVQHIRGVLRIRNTGGYSTVNLENQADAVTRDVTLEDTSGGYVTVSRLAPGNIRVDRDSIRALNIWAGDGGNGFTIHSTPNSNVSAGAVGTTIHTGNGNDVVNVDGTQGALTLDGQGGLNQFVVGGNPTGLNRINGAVGVGGSGGLNYLTVNDAPSTTTHTYVLDRNLVQRTDRAAIFYQDLTGFSVVAGAAYDTIAVRDTTPGLITDVQYSSGNDYFAVARTTGNLHLTAGGSSFIEVGNNVSSLDAIQGAISVYPVGGNSMTLRLVDTAATTHQTLTADANVFGQTYTRSGAAAINVFFSPVANFEYVGGSGGTTAFIYGTTAGTNTRLYGHAGVLDNFYPGWAGDMNRNLGRISFNGQAADNDYAIYYDYLNPNPQTYTVTGDSFFQTLFIDRPGTGGVSSIGLGQVVFYAPGVGGSVENVRGVPAGTFLNMAVGGDTVTLGGGPLGLAVLQGPVAVAGYVDARVSMTVDNSGDFRTGARRVTLRERQGPYDYGHHIEEFAPAAIYWRLDSTSTLALRGGAADETFAMLSTSFGTPLSIDGGGGINALDDSAVPAASGSGVYVNLQTGQATGLTGGVSRIQNVIGSAGDDILVGNGGNVLFGGAGRDLLIGGASASQLFGGGGDDLLIGGTLVDGSRAYLDQVMAVWTSGDAYDARVAALRGLLNDDSVSGNGGGNTLTGEAGLDLFFGSRVTDLQDGEWAFPLVP